MASSIFHTLSLILFHLLLASSTRTFREQTGFRATLTRVPSGKTLPKYTSTNSMNNDPSDSVITSPMKAFQDVYTMTLSIGTPPVQFQAMMDTGSDLIWTKCKTSGSFDTSKSTSFSNVAVKTCSDFGLDVGPDGCVQKYADSSISVDVTLGQETLIIGKEVFNNVTFGCGTTDGIPYEGIVGMGRGNLSLVSQLKQRVFSYCLGSRFDTKTSSVLLTGSKAISENIGTQTTTLLKSDKTHYYYISLEGISVGETKLPVTQSDFAMSSNGDGGMIIDSGTTFTYLDENIVNMISNEFLNQTKLEKSDNNKSYGLEHCFKPPGTNANAPKMVFHFKGVDADADWELPPENYIYKQKGKNVSCLAFIANNEKEDSSVSIFGNMMQQNMMVIYDLDNNNLSFKPENCNMY